MGSGSDRHVMDAAREVLDSFGIESEVKILSAHRTPAALEEWASSARERGLSVLMPEQAWQRIWPASWLRSPHCR